MLSWVTLSFEARFFSRTNPSYFNLEGKENDGSFCIECFGIDHSDNRSKRNNNRSNMTKFRYYDSVQRDKSFKEPKIQTESDFLKLSSFKNRALSDNDGDEPYESKGSAWKMYVAGFSACLGALSVGACMGYSSPALVSMARNESGFEPLDIEEKSWVGSVLTFGALFGGLLAGPFIDRFGRRTLLIASVFPFTLGWLLIAFSGRFAMVIAGRLFCGVCCGAISLVGPVYLSETASPNIRGFFCSCLQLFAFVGTLISFGLGIFIEWKALALTLASLPILLAICMFFMPESPRYLLYKGRRDSAIEGIRFLNGRSINAELVCQDMERALRDQPTCRVSCREVFSPSILKPVTLSMALMFFQQWTGFNGVQFYAGDIFIEAGYNTMDPLVSGIILGAAQTAGTFVSLFLVDRYGRKLLLLVSGLFMIVGLTVLAIFFILKEKHGAEVVAEYGWVTIVSLGLYCSAFALAYGGIPWLIMGEILPLRVRGPASAISTAFNWANCFLVTKTIVSMKSSMTIYGTYFFFDAICVLSSFFVIFFLPETNGRSLEELEIYFASGGKNKNANDEETSSTITLEEK